MKKKLILLVVHFPDQLNNSIFKLKKGYGNLETNLINKELKSFLYKKGYIISTIDTYPIEKADYILFLDVERFDPYFKKIKLLKKNKKLKAKILAQFIESPLIKPFQYKEDILNHFDKILTWKSDIIDNQKFFKYNYPEVFMVNDPFKKKFNNKKFICLINSNKIALGENELYSERKKAARFFETKKEGIDVYGPGWNKKQFRFSVFGHIFFRLGYIIKQLLSLEFKQFFYLIEYIFNLNKLKEKTVKGIAKKSSIETYSEYKFAICFENAKDIPGYSTEKLFNCLNARCIPIYWGDNEIVNYVPKNCFINMNNFKDYESLYIYLKSIDEKTYNQYIRNITNFLKTEKTGKYSNKYFINNFYNNLIR